MKFKLTGSERERVRDKKMEEDRKKIERGRYANFREIHEHSLHVYFVSQVWQWAYTRCTRFMFIQLLYVR